MIVIGKTYSFDSAHQLYREDWSQEDNEKVFGKCASLHGHTYTLKVEVSSPLDPDTEMVINYFDLDRIVKPIVAELDHKFLNDIFPHVLTTSESMVQEIGQWLESVEELETILYAVTLQETPKTFARWTP